MSILVAMSLPKEYYTNDMKKLIIVICILLVGAVALIFFFPKTSQAPTIQTSPTIPSPTQRVSYQPSIYFIALEDNGQSGDKIGCNDSVVAVKRTPAKSTTPLKDTLVDLLSYKEQYFGESGFYNALYQSNLSVENAIITDGHAVISLKGSLQIGGICDAPRVQAQLEKTVLQFSEVKKITITVNGESLDNALSQK